MHARRTALSLSLVVVAFLTGCARMGREARPRSGADGWNATARSGSVVPVPVAIATMDHGTSPDLPPVEGRADPRDEVRALAGGVDGPFYVGEVPSRVAIADGFTGHVSGSTWVLDQPSAATVDALLVAHGGGVDGAFPTQMPAQAGGADMSDMQSGRAASQAGSMTEMMGVPGLVPFDVMTGQAGRWMVGYQFMIEKLDSNLDGSRKVSETEILATYPTSPTDMTMLMHMAMVMYAPTDRLTLMAMLPYVKMSMGELHRDGSRSTERSEGIGDLEVRGMYSLYAAKDHHHTFLANFGVGLPTGSIEARDPEGMRMEYPMQIGSGTYSLLPGFTYLGQSLPWGWAADFHATLRLGRNDVGYRFGNRYQSSVSVARELPNGLSLSTGLRGELWENITGADPLLDPADEPTKDPNLQGGRRLGAFFGVALHPEYGPLEGQHFHAQLELPIVESLDGPQLKRSWVLRLGWQLEF